MCASKPLAKKLVVKFHKTGFCHFGFNEKVNRSCISHYCKCAVLYKVPPWKQLAILLNTITFRI